MDPIRALCYGLIVAFAVLLFLAKRNPQQRWVFWLFGYCVGPRTDIQYLTRSQLWSSSWRFLAWGLFCLGLLMSVVKFPQLSGWGPGAPGSTVVLALVLVLLCGIGFVGGVYLFVRFLFRSSSYVPPPNSAAQIDAFRSAPIAPTPSAPCRER